MINESFQTLLLFLFTKLELIPVSVLGKNYSHEYDELNFGIIKA